MTELIVRWKNGETAIYRFTTKGDAVTAKMIFENHCKDEIKEIKINVLEQQPTNAVILNVTNKGRWREEEEYYCGLKSKKIWWDDDIVAESEDTE